MSRFAVEDSEAKPLGVRSAILFTHNSNTLMLAL